MTREVRSEAILQSDTHCDPHEMLDAVDFVEPAP